MLQEWYLRFDNNLTLFFLCLKRKMKLFQLGVRWYIESEREKSPRTWSGAAGCEWPTVLMRTDGFVTVLQTLGAYCACVPAAKTDGLVQSKEPGGYQRWTQNSLTPHATLLHAGAWCSCHLPLHPCEWTQCSPRWAEATLAGGDLRSDSCSEDLLLPWRESLPSLLAVQHAFLEAEERGRDIPYVGLGQREKKGKMSFSELLQPGGETQSIRRTLSCCRNHQGS